MALKPTIYKIQLNLADSDRGLYEGFSLTLARHPSETLERLTARVLAYGLLAEPGLEFTRGLSTTEEPDLWRHSDSGEIEHWVEVGQPEPARLRKACGRAPRVTAMAYGKSAGTWWANNGGEIARLSGLEVWRLPWAQMQAAARLVDRNVTLSLGIAGGTLYLDSGGATETLEPEPLLTP